MITKEQLTAIVNTFTDEKWDYESIKHELICSCAYCVNGLNNGVCDIKIKCSEHAEEFLKSIIKDY